MTHFDHSAGIYTGAATPAATPSAASSTFDPLGMEGLVVTTDIGESFVLEKRNLEQGMRALLAESNNAPPLVALSNATDLTLTHAEQLFQNGHHDTAHAFIKMGHVLHTLGQKTAEFLSAAAHEAFAVTKKTVRERIKNPSAYLLEQAKNLVDSYKQATLLALQFGTYATQDLETMLIRDLHAPGTVGSSDEMEHALRSYFNPTGIMLNDVVKNLTPTQAGTLLGNLVGTVAVNKASKALFNKALSSVSKSAQTFANAMHDNAGKKLADQHGKKSVNKTINDLRKEPEKLSASKDVVKEVEKTATAVGKNTKKWTLIIEQSSNPKLKFSESEVRAAKYMHEQGANVILRHPSGTRAGGGTSDLLINGIRYDVYTPISSNPNSIIRGMADKNSQTSGIVLDLAKTSVTEEQLGNALRRVRGVVEAGRKQPNIIDIVILPKT